MKQGVLQGYILNFTFNTFSCVQIEFYDYSGSSLLGPPPKRASTGLGPSSLNGPGRVRGQVEGHRFQALGSGVHLTRLPYVGEVNQPVVGDRGFKVDTHSCQGFPVFKLVDY